MALTDEDKEWMTARSEEDKEWMTARSAEGREWMTGQLETVHARVERELSAQLEIVNAKIERVETALLTEFHKWASPAEMRARTHAAAIRTIDMEMEAIDDRVTKLEHPPS